MDQEFVFEKSRIGFLILIVSITESMIRKNTLGIAPVVAVLVLLGAGVPGGLGLPVAVDRISGDSIGPNSALYGLEIAGENMQP